MTVVSPFVSAQLSPIREQEHIATTWLVAKILGRRALPQPRISHSVEEDNAQPTIEAESLVEQEGRAHARVAAFSRDSWRVSY
jgi:hypothetical protein